MQRLLGRRVLRELKENFMRYLALFLLIVLGMYMIVAMIGGAELVIQNVERGQRENHLEDGQFSVFVPLTYKELDALEAAGITIERNFSMDYDADGGVIRIMRQRELANLFTARDGAETAEPGEILLEQHFADSHGVKVGDAFLVGGHSYMVAGLGSTPDYDAVYEKMSDTGSDSFLFGTGFINDVDYNRMKAEGKSFRTEEYCYSYLLNGKMTDDELKEMLQEFELDRSLVEDTYFLEMLEELEESKTEMEDGLEELVDGCEELADGLAELSEHNEELTDAADSLFEAMLDQANEGFADNGIAVTLKEASFEAQLDKMMKNPAAYSGETKQGLQDTKESLQSLRDFKDGMKEYVDGVHDLSCGSGDLCGGLSEIVKHNDGLNAGVNQIFAMMEPMVAGDAQQLAELTAFRDGVLGYTAAVKQASLGSQQLTYGMSVLYSSSHPIVDGTNKLFDAMLEMTNEQLAESELGITLTADNFEAELDKLTAENSIVDGKLKDSLQDTKEMLQDLQDFKDGIQEYTDAVTEAADGTVELVDGVKELQEEALDMLDEYFTVDIDNLTSFVPKENNPRVGASVNDVLINKLAGFVAGIIVMILFTYVISVFVVHSIETESSVIGALYSMGVRRNQLLLHYLVLPVVITFLGGAVGLVLGFSPAGVGFMSADVVAYFSMPVLKPVYPVYVMVYSLVMPPLAAIIVNCLVINKKLNRTALSMLRGEVKRGRIREIDLKGLSFPTRFQIRQILREMRSAFTIIGGMFICLLILMIGVNCYVLCTNFSKGTMEETKYEYLYSYKYPTEEIPRGGTEGYMESLKKEAFGYHLDVSIIGLTEDNPYYEVSVSKKENEIVISSAVASKFSVDKGEKLVLTDEVNDKDYAFTIVEVVPFNSGLYTFMDIDAMRELFGQEEDYYNVVFAGEKLNIDSGRLYATTSKETIAEASEIFVEMMGPMIIMMGGIAALIFLVVMYLMMKVMIDRSSFNIALMKVFGYRKKEIKKLYLDGNFYVVALGALICIPASKLAMDGLYPYFISNVAMGMDLDFTWHYYVGIYVAIMALYLVINKLLVRRIMKVNLSEVLKNRE